MKAVSHSAIRNRTGSLASRCLSICAISMKTRLAVARSAMIEPKLTLTGWASAIRRSTARR